MGNRLWVVWLAAGCGGGVHTSKDAPFAVGAIKSALWSVWVDSDQQYQSAILILSNEKTECTVVDGKPMYQALDESTRGAQGVLFLLDQNVADGGAALEWTGTWVDDEASLPGSASWGARTMTPVAFETGVLYDIYSDPSSWLRLDDVGSDNVSGEFWTDWWSGSFKAETCGGWIIEDSGFVPSSGSGL